MVDPTSIDRLRLGDHLCWTFDDDDMCLTAMAGYTRAGLVRSHKVVLFTDVLLPEALAAGLEDLGVPVDEARADGQFEVRRAADSYLPRGVFEPVALLASLAGMASDARADGWAGLRLAGDMTWAARTVPGGQRLLWYEAQINRFYAAGYAMGVCFYDRRMFTAAELERVSAAHPGTTGAGAHGPWRPLLRILRTSRPPGVRLTGEADLSTRDALSAVLTGLFEDALPDAPAVTIDVSRLDFADAATAALLDRVGRASPGRVRLVGCSPALGRTLELVAGAAPPSMAVERR